MDKKEYQTTQLGLIYGPYGYVGYVGTIKREDLKEVAQTFFGLFRLVKHHSKCLWHSYKKSYRRHIEMTLRYNRHVNFTSLF